MKKIFLTLMTILLAALAVQAATPINVAGVDVSCTKDQTITASCITSGTVTYTYSTNTLTLTNATITRTGGSNYCIHNRSNDGLIVKFVGTCNLTAEGRVIYDKSGRENELVATSGSTVNLTSTGDGAIYVRDFTWLWIKGPGTFNIKGPKNGAIAGHGSWNSSSTDGSTQDRIYFSDVTATITGAQSSLLGLYEVRFYPYSNVTLKATNNSSYPVVRQVKDINLLGTPAILAPWGSAYSSSSESIVLNGSRVFNQDIYISDNYALLLNETNFPDEYFRDAMLSLYPKGYLTQSELLRLTSLNVANKDISDMTGIEKLTYLQKLYCYGNSFTSLNLNSNTALTYLDCGPNTQLNTLAFYLCTNLETLICYQTGITELYLDNFSNLKTLKCYSTKLTGLTVSNMTQLTSVDCSYCTSMTSLSCHDNNALTTLNVSGNTALKTFTCYDNPVLSALNCSSLTSLETLTCNDNNALTMLNASGCTSLETLSCYNNNALTTLNASGCTSLETLSCYDNNALTTLNVTGNTSMETLTCNHNNALKTLNCSGLTSLTKLFCYNNALTTLNVSGNTALMVLNCYNNPNLTTITGLADCRSITVMDCSYCALTDLSACNSMPHLKKLYCYSNKLTSLTLTYKAQLIEVDAKDNTSLTTANITNNSALETLNVKRCTAMTTLNCYNNKLTTLDVTGNTALKMLYCSTNSNLSSITGLSSCTGLTILSCPYCALTDLSACSYLDNLASLICSGNRLTSLTVTSKSKLTSVLADNNPLLTTATIQTNPLLNTLEIYNCKALTTLYCVSNPAMTALDVADCTALDTLWCYNDKLSSLNLSTCTALKDLNCNSNKLITLDLSSNTALKTLKCKNNKLSLLNLLSNTKLRSVNCSNNELTVLSVKGLLYMQTLDCSFNKLTTVGVSGCSSLTELKCHANQMADMDWVVSTLRNRTSYSTPGVLYALYDTNEGNVFTESNLADVEAKNWIAKRWDGASWVDITFGTPSTDGFLVLPDITAPAGSTVTIPIGINDVYDHDYAQFQVDFFCPEEFEVVGCEKGELVDGSTQTQIYSGSTVVDGRNRYRMIVANFMTGNNNQLVMGDEGTILYVTVNIPANASGQYAISLEEASFVIAGAGSSVNPDNVTATLTIGTPSSIRGDVNSDGYVDINDVTRLIDVVLGKNVEYDASAADCTLDGRIDIQDVTSLISRVLTGSW